MEKLQPAQLELTAHGDKISVTGDDSDQSLADAATQSQRVFLDGNELPERWHGKDRFVILETGFGLGLNFLTTWQAWHDDPQRCRRLHFVALEKHPFKLADLVIAQQAWPQFTDRATELQAKWPPLTPGVHRLHLDGGHVILTLFFGDVTSQLRAVDATVDAFFLDSFAPSKNSPQWTPYFCKGLTRLATSGSTLASKTLTPALREALTAAEFEVHEQASRTGKQPMLLGHFRSRRPNRHPAPTDRRAIVIGAGLAGSTTAHRLASAGWQVTVLEQASEAGSGASSNLAGMLRPLPSADDNRLSRLTRAAYLATRALLAELPDSRWSACGIMHLAREGEHEAQQKRAVETLGLPPEVLQFVDAAEASRKLNWPVERGGWWFPNAGWVQPPSLCRAALAAYPEHITTIFNAAVDQLKHTKTGWQILDAAGTLLAEAPYVIMASGVAATSFEQLAWLPQKSARGQVSHLPTCDTPALDIVVCKLGYVMPVIDGIRLVGASHLLGDPEPATRQGDHRDNLARLQLMLPGFAAAIKPADLDGRVGFRPMSPDRLPIVGPVPEARPAGSNSRLHELPRQPGLWCVQGFGARGIVWSALMADLLLSQLEGEPLPLENDLADALDPGRFLIKGARRSDTATDDT